MNMLTVMLQAQGGGDLSFILMMVAIFAIMYSPTEQKAERNC